MPVRGTRLLMGREAAQMRGNLTTCHYLAIEAGFQEIMVPTLGDPALWTTDRNNSEIEGQMWTFMDKGRRATCLIPEVTAVIQAEYNAHWKQSLPKPVRLFYQSRCYRYERPQAGRYREFTQFGVEMLGPDPEACEQECVDLLDRMVGMMLDEGSYWLDRNAKRGLSYYSRDGFEIRDKQTDMQLAGGGVYAEGCGFAIGMDRILLCQPQGDE